MSLQSLIFGLPLVAGLASAQCYSGVNIFQARGTGEALQGSLSDIAANYSVMAIPDSHLTKVLYPANTTFGASVLNGTQLMSSMVTDYHKQCPDSKIVLEGYSQGAIVTGNVLTGADPRVPALSEDVGKQIVAIIQYGDPGYQANQSYARADCTKSAGGVRQGEQAEKFNSYSSRIISFCHAQDPVCCTGGNLITAHVSYFTNDNAQEVADFVKKQYDEAEGSSGGSGSQSGSATPSGSATATGTPAATSAGSEATPTGTAATGGDSAGGATPTQPSGSGAAGGASPSGTPAGSAPAPTNTGAAGRVSLSTAGYSLSAMLLAAFML